MMSTLAPSDYLSALSRRGVRLWVDNGRLHYHASKGTLSAADLEQLRLMKSALMSELTQSTATQEAASPLASLQQQWLLGLFELHPDWAQRQAYAFSLEGAVDARVLGTCLDIVCGRHGLASTRLQELQVARNFAANETDNIRARVAQCMQQSNSDMLHMTLLHRSPTSHYLILVAHRLVADCLALTQLFKELWLLYAEAVHRQPAQLVAQPIQYEEYVRWQHSSAADWQSRHGAYWEQQLDGARCLEWPRLSDDDSGRVWLEHALGANLSAAIRDLARQCQSLPALTLLTLYVAAAEQWSDQRDFVVPFNMAGRHAAQDGAVGCFAYPLFLRLTLRGNESFRELLRVVSSVFYKAVAHQDYGRMAARRPDLLDGSFCQYLAWHPAAVSGAEMYDLPARSGIAARPVLFQTAADLANLPPRMTGLDVCFFDRAGTTHVLLIARPRNFSRDTLERFAQRLQKLAEQFTADSNQTL